MLPVIKNKQFSIIDEETKVRFAVTSIQNDKYHVSISNPNNKSFEIMMVPADILEDYRRNPVNYTNQYGYNLSIESDDEDKTYSISIRHDNIIVAVDVLQNMFDEIMHKFTTEMKTVIVDETRVTEVNAG